MSEVLLLSKVIIERGSTRTGMVLFPSSNSAQMTWKDRSTSELKMQKGSMSADRPIGKDQFTKAGIAKLFREKKGPVQHHLHRPSDM